MNNIPPSVLITLGPASDRQPGYRQVIDGITYETNGISWDEITEQDVPLVYTADTLPDPATLGAGASVVVDDFVAVNALGSTLSYIPKTLTLVEMLNTVGVEGARVRVSDCQSAPDFYWNTALGKWQLTAPWAVVEDSVVKTRTSANTSADTTDALMSTITLPNIMGPNSRCQIRYYYTSEAGTTVAKTVFAKWAGVGLPSTAINAAQTGRTSEVNIYNDNSYVAQKCANADNPTGNYTNAMYALQGDTANPLTIGFYSKFGAAVSNESVSIQHISVVIYP